MSRFQNLPKDITVKTALGLDLSEVLNLCKTSRDFNNKICQNPNFWTQRLYQDYGMEYTKFSAGETPKELYQKVKRISETKRFDYKYKYTGPNIKLIDYLNEIGGNIGDALTEAAVIPNPRILYPFIDQLLARGAPIKLGMLGAARKANTLMIEYLEKKMRNLRSSVEEIKEINDMGLHGAATNGNPALVDYFIKKGAAIQNLAAGSMAGGQIKLLEKHIREMRHNPPPVPGPEDLFQAGQFGKKNIIEWFLGFPGQPWNLIGGAFWIAGHLVPNEHDMYIAQAYAGAIAGGYNDLANFIQSVKNNHMLPSFGLYGAAIAGDLGLVREIIPDAMDPQSLLMAVGGAVVMGNKEVADYILDFAQQNNIPVDLNNEFISANLVDFNNITMFRYIIERGFTNLDMAINQAKAKHRTDLAKYLESQR